MRRRQFFKGLGSAVAALASSGALASQRVVGANERVNVGLIGCGARGTHVARLMKTIAGVELAAVCDVYRPHAERAKQWAGPGARAYYDFREVLDRNDIHAVLLATPDHWHAIPTVLACQAGKDVYVEKPLAHNIREGRAMVDAARKYDRVVQVGTQHRSAEHYRRAAQIVQSGQLGKVHFVRIWNYTNIGPNGIGRREASPPPEGLDWNFYLGPAPDVPYNRNRFLGTFRWFWDYAGGRITDWGTHRFDSLHQMMGVHAPISVTAAGKHLDLGDGTETPNVLQVTYEYADFVLSYEACNVNAHGTGGRNPGMKYYRMKGSDDRPNGTALYGTRGTLMIDRIGFEIYPEPQRDGQAATSPDHFGVQRERAVGRDRTDLHVKDFIDSVRSRKRPAADVQIGHQSSIVPHLGNIAYRTGRKFRWDAERESIAGDAESSELLGRAARPPWDLI